MLAWFLTLSTKSGDDRAASSSSSSKTPTSQGKAPPIRLALPTLDSNNDPRLPPGIPAHLNGDNRAPSSSSSNPATSQGTVPPIRLALPTLDPHDNHDPTLPPGIPAHLNVKSPVLPQSSSSPTDSESSVVSPFAALSLQSPKVAVSRTRKPTRQPSLPYPDPRSRPGWLPPTRSRTLPTDVHTGTGSPAPQVNLHQQVFQNSKWQKCRHDGCFYYAAPQHISNHEQNPHPVAGCTQVRSIQFYVMRVMLAPAARLRRVSCCWMESSSDSEESELEMDTTIQVYPLPSGHNRSTWRVGTAP